MGFCVSNYDMASSKRNVQHIKIMEYDTHIFWDCFTEYFLKNQNYRRKKLKRK